MAMICVCGCGSRAVPKHSATVENLNMIGRAYASATDELAHPPKSKAEFLPYLQAILADRENAAREQADGDTPVAAADASKRTVENVMRSDSDGEEFVIHWGADCRGPRSRKAPVLAYEKHGKDGHRYVLQGTRGARLVNDKDFAELTFPSGFSPP
jgi:hypothetical protein